MSLAQIFAVVAVLAVVVFALGQRLSRRPEDRRSLAWLVGVAAAIWLGLAALVMGWFFVGHALFDEAMISFPEGEALAYIALRDGPYAEELDAEVSWTALHPDIRAQTSRSEFIECFFAGGDRSTPPDPAAAVDELERSLWGVGFFRGEVPSDNVLVKDGNTYSIAGRRTEGRISALDVRVEGPSNDSVTTVLLAEGEVEGWSSHVVGTEPADPCVVGSEFVRERLQSTAMITIGHYRGELPELSDYQVLAVVWEGNPDELNLVGGAYWGVDDGGNGGSVVRPPDEGDGSLAPAEGDDDLHVEDPEQPDEPAEPPPPGEWMTRAFLQSSTAQIEPGAYTIEVWANPIELAPSATSGVPADTAERHCVIDVDVNAGTHVDVFIEDLPTGGSCRNEIKLREPLAAPDI